MFTVRDLVEVVDNDSLISIIQNDEQIYQGTAAKLTWDRLLGLAVRHLEYRTNYPGEWEIKTDL